MKLCHLIVFGRLIMLVIAGAMAWHFIAPPFMDTTVDESCRSEVPSQTALAQMPASGMQEIEAECLAAIPGEKTMGETAGRL